MAEIDTEAARRFLVQFAEANALHRPAARYLNEIDRLRAENQRLRDAVLAAVLAAERLSHSGYREHYRGNLGEFTADRMLLQEVADELRQEAGK